MTTVITIVIVIIIFCFVFSLRFHVSFSPLSSYNANAASGRNRHFNFSPPNTPATVFLRAINKTRVHLYNTRTPENSFFSVSLHFSRSPYSPPVLLYSLSLSLSHPLLLSHFLSLTLSHPVLLFYSLIFSHSFSISLHLFFTLKLTRLYITLVTKDVSKLNRNLIRTSLSIFLSHSLSLSLFNYIFPPTRIQPTRVYYAIISVLIRRKRH